MMLSRYRTNAFDSYGIPQALSQFEYILEEYFSAKLFFGFISDTISNVIKQLIDLKQRLFKIITNSRYIYSRIEK